jgi:hypothetical protein
MSTPNPNPLKVFRVNPSGGIMRQIGSQIRETLEDAGYTIINQGPEGIILEEADGKRELWVERDDFAGYVVEVNGVGYEFVRDVSAEDA